jgi:glycosyltransferase involved in cell wall biosynthesis
LVPNGIRPEAEAMSANWQAQRELRLQARQRGAATQVICCGSVIPRKRPNELMAAMQALNNPSAQAHFVGTVEHMGLFEDEVFRQAQRDPQAFGGRYTFHGELRFEPTQALLAQGDFLVSCSGDESQGMATLEAAMHGLPPLLSDLECYQGIWKHGENALLFPVGATRVMAWQLNGLLQDPLLCHSLGQAARQVALRYRWDEFTDGFDRALARSLGIARGQNPASLPR